MNILHMEYVVKVADTGSLAKASEELLIAPSNLSRSIKEIEASLGVTLFDRSSRGMFLTRKGEAFVNCARSILNQINDLENSYKVPESTKQTFSISVPRASYIAEAFVRFSKGIDAETVENYYKETNAYNAIKNILEFNYQLGIIRYASHYDKYFKDMLDEKKLAGEILTEFQCVLIMSSKSPLANKNEIHFSDLRPLIEIAHADTFVPSLPFSVVKKDELTDDITRRIFVFERGSQFDLLANNTETFMWVSPVPDTLLRRYNLIQRECVDNTKTYKDVLIYRRDYKLSELDKKFISEVRKTIANVSAKI